MSEMGKGFVEKEREGEVALVTGASRGVGRAVAKAFAERGVSVALVARSREALEETAALCRAHGSRAACIPTDLSEGTGAQRAVEACIAEFGHMDHVVNAAGLSGAHRDRVSTADDELWNQILGVNLRASMNIARLCVPHLESRGGGTIVNIASASGRYPTSGLAYVASKFGIVGFTESLFEGVRDKGIKVSVIIPGFMNTGMMMSGYVSSEVVEQVKERLIQPEDVAKAVIFVVGAPSTSCPIEIRLRPQQAPFDQEQQRVLLEQGVSPRTLVGGS